MYAHVCIDVDAYAFHIIVHNCTPRTQTIFTITSISFAIKDKISSPIFIYNCTPVCLFIKATVEVGAGP